MAPSKGGPDLPNGSESKSEMELRSEGYEPGHSEGGLKKLAWCEGKVTVQIPWPRRSRPPHPVNDPGKHRVQRMEIGRDRVVGHPTESAASADRHLAAKAACWT